MNVLDFYNGKKVFVTGHTGFKGSWLCKILKKAGADIVGYSLEPPTSPSLFEEAEIKKDVKEIIRNGVAYIQVLDFQRLLEKERFEFLSSEVFSILFREASKDTDMFIMCKDNENDFIEFRNPKSVEFLTSFEEIVDFDEIKDLSCEEMDALRVCIINEKNEIASKVNMMSAEEQKQHPELFERYNTLSSKFMSLNDVYWFKRGKAKLVLPDDEKELKPISFGNEIKLRLKNAFNRKNNK